MARRPRSVLDLVVGRVGARRGYRVGTFLVSWSIVYQALGRAPSIEEYGDWWKLSRSTAFREQALFREAFPGEHDPERVVVAMLDAWDSRQGVRGLGGVPASLVAA
jgi:hypothetical protein